MSSVSFQAAMAAWAENMVEKWHPERSPYAAVPCIFTESRDEARRFLCAVREIHQILAASPDPSSGSTLLHVAMRRLRREFYHVLHATTAQLYEPALPTTATSSSSPVKDDSYSTDTESFASLSDDDGLCPTLSVYTDLDRTPQAAALSYLRSVADCMLSAGYASDCTAAYVACRRAAVQDALRTLGLDDSTGTKLGRDKSSNTLLLLNSWTTASRTAVRAVFARERGLCETIFGFGTLVAEACYADVTRDASLKILQLPCVLFGKMARPRARRRRGTPYHLETAVLGLLEVHETLRELTREMKALLSSEATAVLEQASESTRKVGTAVRGLLADFEAAVHKDAQRQGSKKSASSLPPGGDLHPLTLRVVGFLTSLADHAASLSPILASNEIHECSSPSPRRVSSTNPQDAVSSLFAWLLTVLLCKLDVKVELYRNPVIAYLFLANNLRYVTSQVRSHRSLLTLLGTEWADAHDQNARRFTACHLQLAWAKVTTALPADLANVVQGAGRMEAVADRVREFNAAFDEACGSLAGAVVPDDDVSDELRRCAADCVVGPYRRLYALCRGTVLGKGVIRFSPEDVMSRLVDLYSDTGLHSGCSSVGSSLSGSGSGSGS